MIIKSDLVLGCPYSFHNTNEKGLYYSLGLSTLGSLQEMKNGRDRICSSNVQPEINFLKPLPPILLFIFVPFNLSVMQSCFSLPMFSLRICCATGN